MSITHLIDKIDYFEFLNALDAPKIPLDEQQEFKKQFPKRKVITMRHDVDRSIAHALDFANEEAGQEIRSTYFLLHTKRYFDYSDAFADQCRALIELGHTIGLHSDALFVWLKTKEDLKNIVMKPLKWLRSLGIPVKGVSAHGNRKLVPLGCNNRDIWAENPYRVKHNLEDLRPITLASCGLEYEAYSLRENNISDSGRRWSGNVNGRIEQLPLPQARTDMKGRAAIRRKLIDAYNKMPEPKEKGLKKGVLQLVIHPCWWEVCN